eukprot:scaffold18927_cov51-Isochrysis_galbana.AAC.1
MAAAIELDEFRLTAAEAGLGEDSTQDHLVKGGRRGDHLTLTIARTEPQPHLSASHAGSPGARGGGREMRLITKMDSLALKLFSLANKTERNARALDIALQLQLPKSLHGALKLANHFKLGQLAERITRRGPPLPK